MNYPAPRLLSPSEPPGLFTDARGGFAETWRSEGRPDGGYGWDGAVLPPMICGLTSHSKANVLRGLHYQSRNPRALIIRCAYGAIIDVAVDLRAGSHTFGQGWRFTLTAPYGTVYIPRGLAHGFYCPTQAVVMYDCSEVFDPESTGVLRANDPDLRLVSNGKPLWGGIQMHATGPLMSDKDRNGNLLCETMAIEVQ